MMKKLDVFMVRMKKLGIDLKLSGNYPWIYLDSVNGNVVKEIYQSNHFFTFGYYPIRPDQEFHFTDIGEIFKVIRNYKNVKLKNE